MWWGQALNKPAYEMLGGKAGKYLITNSFLNNFRYLGNISQLCALPHVGRDAISQCGNNNHTT